MPNARPPSFAWVYAPTFLLSLVVFGLGVFLAARGEYAMLAAGSLAVIVVMSAWPVAWALSQQTHHTIRRAEEHLLQLRQKLDQNAHALNRIGDQQLLSDRAKAIAYRENDREALRRAIREDIDKQDWDAALRLADDMDKVFGYRQEAADVRQDVLARRNDLVRRQIDDSEARLTRHAADGNWQQATDEISRLRRMFPEERRVDDIEQNLQRRRTDTKQRLLSEWHAAVDSGDHDKAVDLLRDLDAYLTPEEGRGLEEKARQMFKGRLESLRTRFAAAVHENRWPEAIDLGESIIDEFPNAQMANEVRDKMPVLKERALNGTNARAAIAG